MLKIRRRQISFAAPIRRTSTMAFPFRYNAAVMIVAASGAPSARVTLANRSCSAHCTK